MAAMALNITAWRGPRKSRFGQGPETSSQPSPVFQSADDGLLHRFSECGMVFGDSSMDSLMVISQRLTTQLLDLCPALVGHRFSSAPA